MQNLNVLSQRYASPEMNKTFSRDHRTITERELWILIMNVERELGVPIPAEVIAQFERALHDFDYPFEKKMEKKLRHDVMAKIRHFIRVAGNPPQQIHRPLTSRDLSDEVEQVIFMQASRIVFGKYVSTLRHFIDNSVRYRDLYILAKTHNVPAQVSTLGRRFAMWAEEQLYHLENFEAFVANYPFRGVRGAVGTQFELLSLLHDKEKVAKLQEIVAGKLGFSRVFIATGQVYPRSLDYALVSQLSLIACACGSFATTMRLMAGHELVNEGFSKDQVGSSAMAFKRNARTCERICSFLKSIMTQVDGLSRISGNQWYEGDVSCSMQRRLCIPDAFYASDGLLETALTVLKEMIAYPEMFQREIDRLLSFMATTEILVKATEAGLGREQAHGIIREYALAEAIHMQETGVSENQLAEKLADDPIFKEAGINLECIKAVLSDLPHFAGNALQQIDDVAEQARELIGRHKEDSLYEPLPIL